LAVDRVELTGLRFRQPQDASGADAKPHAFQVCDDLSRIGTGKRVGLDDGEGDIAFHGHRSRSN
jgi:hypothetical protein